MIPLADEALIEPAMALMSSGVAFVALVAEALRRRGRGPRARPAPTRVRMAVETHGRHGRLRSTATTWTCEGLQPLVATPAASPRRGSRRSRSGGLRDACRAAVDTVVEATR